MSSEPTLVTLSVELMGTDPVIWRTINVDADMPLDRFHQVRHSAMGRTGSHLHALADRDLRGGTGCPVAGARRWLDSDSIDEGLEGFDETTETSSCSSCW